MPSESLLVLCSATRIASWLQGNDLCRARITTKNDTNNSFGDRIVAEQNIPPEDVTENPLGGNGKGAAVEEATPEEGRKSYKKKEEFVRARNQIADRLGRVREDLAKVDTEDLGRRVGEWVRENPLLAISIAAGAGILMGRGLTALLTPSPPPPLSVRARRRAAAVAHSAHDYLGDVGDVLSDRAADAGAYLRKRADEAGKELSRKAKEFSDELAKRTGELADAMADSAGKARESAADAAHELPDLIKHRAGHSRDFADSLLGTVKAATAAMVVRRVGEWMRRA